MLDDLVSSFLGSGAGSDAIAALTKDHGLSPEQAKGAVSATAEGGVQALTSGLQDGLDLGDLAGLAGMLGGGGQSSGGALGALGGLLGGGQGGGLGGLAGMLGGGAAAPSTGGLPPQLVKTVSDFVASKTGMQAATAQSIVGSVLPQVIEFAKGKLGK